MASWKAKMQKGHMIQENLFAGYNNYQRLISETDEGKIF